MAFLTLAAMVAASQEVPVPDDATVPGVMAEETLGETPPVCAVLVGGVNKDPEERQNKDRNVLRMHRIFEQASGGVHVLVDKGSLVRNTRTVAAPGTSSHASIQKTLANLAKSVSPDARFVFLFTGQANLVGETLRLNLDGQDLTHAELVEWLAPIPAREMVVILDCPHAGVVVKPLCERLAPTRPGSLLVVCSSRGDQPYATRFGDFFIPALSDPESDGDASGTISVLEAFQLACQRVDAMYRDANLMKTETALLEDNGDGVPSQQPWRHLEEAGDGELAGRTVLAEDLSW